MQSKMDDPFDFDNEEDDFAAIFELLQSDEEEVVERGGSRQGSSRNLDRNRARDAALLHRDYFCETPCYS